MKTSLTSRELETRFRKARNPIVAEISGDLTILARTNHLDEFLRKAKGFNRRKSIFLVAWEE